MSGKGWSVAVAVLAMVVGGPRGAEAVTYSASSGNLSATVDFNLVGNTLTVVLANTSLNDVLLPADVLTAVFFSSSGTLTEVSAVSGGPTFLNGVQVNPAGTVVGGEWGYETGLIGAPGGALQGISSSGLGVLFGNPTFPGANLGGPTALNGLQYGITSVGDDLLTGNGGIMHNELTKNSVIFTFTVDNAFSLTSLRDISFQYGASLDNPCFTGRGVPCGSGQRVPEPATGLLLGTMLLSLGIGRWMRNAG